MSAKEAWRPAAHEERAAVDLLARLLALPPGEQLNVLALVARLWCYRRDTERGS